MNGSNNREKRTKRIGILLIPGIILLVIILMPHKGRFERPKISLQSDLSKHPIYTKYEFDKTENIINIGIQPLYLPTGMISAAMKRDTTLSEVLSGLDIKIRYYSFLKGDDVNYFLRRGDLDVGIGGDMPAIFAAATLDVVIPALIQQGFISIVADRHMLMSELRRRRIGFAFGSNAHYALLKALASEGLSEAEVILIPMEATEMPEALHSGEIDAFSAWEPTPAITTMKDPGSVVIHRVLSSGYLYFLKAFSDQHPEAVRQIIAAEIRAIRWMQSDRRNLLLAGKWAIQAGEKLSGQNIGLSVEQYADLAVRDILGLTSAPIVPKNDFKRNGPLHMEYEFLEALGKISPSSSWEKVRDSFDCQIIAEVFANPKRYDLDDFNYEAHGGGNE